MRASLPVLDLIPSRNQSRPQGCGLMRSVNQDPTAWGSDLLGKSLLKGSGAWGPRYGHRDQLQLTLRIPESPQARGHVLVTQVPQGLLGPAHPAQGAWRALLGTSLSASQNFPYAHPCTQASPHQNVWGLILPFQVPAT